MSAYDLYSDQTGDQPARFSHTWNPVIKKDRLPQCNISSPLGVAHGRELLDKAGLFDESISYEEDWDLWKRLAQCGARFVFTPEKSGRYYARPESQSRTRRIPDATTSNPSTAVTVEPE